jgi:hypothetical protein
MKLIEDAFERLARAMAEACNGGRWDNHYTEDQKNVWRKRATRIVDRD